MHPNQHFHLCLKGELSYVTQVQAGTKSLVAFMDALTRSDTLWQAEQQSFFHAKTTKFTFSFSEFLSTGLISWICGVVMKVTEHWPLGSLVQRKLSISLLIICSHLLYLVTLLGALTPRWEPLVSNHSFCQMNEKWKKLWCSCGSEMSWK